MSKTITITKEQTQHLETLPTVSSKIRYLNEQKYTTSQTATILNKRYQHVRNVLLQPLKGSK